MHLDKRQAFSPTRCLACICGQSVMVTYAYAAMVLLPVCDCCVAEKTFCLPAQALTALPRRLGPGGGTLLDLAVAGLATDSVSTAALPLVES